MTNTPRFCPHCGAAQTRADARFCQSCGQPLPQRPAPPAATPTPSPKPARRNRRLLGGLLTAILLLALAVVVLALPSTRSALLALVSRQSSQVSPTGMPAGGGHKLPSPRAIASSTAPLPTAPAPVATATPPSTAVSLATATPPHTATPVVTATPVPALTTSPSPPLSSPQATVLQAVNLRTGPGQEYDTIRLMPVGESLALLARSQQGDWLQVVTSDGANGWAFAQYLNTSGATAQLPIVVAPSLPPCPVAVDGALRSVYSRSELGCPTGGARITWSAWQPFDGGAMLWRDDTNQVTVFYNGAGWTTLADQWNQVSPAPGRGVPPAGRQAPVRGFAWIWGNRDEVFRGLRWATDEEKGVCMLVQDFERGFAFAKSQVATCTDRQGTQQSSRAAELPPILIAAHSNGAGWQGS